MSKKKKNKTRKQKEKAIINRQKYLSLMNKPETALKERQVELVKEAPKAIQKITDNKEIEGNKFTISNIKRSIIYSVVFILLIFGLYFLELRIQYFTHISDYLVSILTK